METPYFIGDLFHWRPWRAYMFYNQNFVKYIILQNLFYKDQYFIENVKNYVCSTS